MYFYYSLSLSLGQRQCLADVRRNPELEDPASHICLDGPSTMGNASSFITEAAVGMVTGSSGKRNVKRNV